MPVIQQAQPVLIQGAPTQATMPRVVPVQIQQGATLPANVTTLPAPVKKVANHIPLARCRVLYLGSAVPLETSQGIDAVQGPCRERYPFQGEGEVKGIDAWLSVFSSGILLSYVDDKSGNTWFPIQSLYVCTAVKCAIQVDGLTGEKNAKFVALDSEEAKGSMHPPMFAAIMRRTKGKKVLGIYFSILFYYFLLGSKMKTNLPSTAQLTRFRPHNSQEGSHSHPTSHQGEAIFVFK